MEDAFVPFEVYWQKVVFKRQPEANGRKQGQMTTPAGHVRIDPCRYVGTRKRQATGTQACGYVLYPYEIIVYSCVLCMVIQVYVWLRGTIFRQSSP